MTTQHRSDIHPDQEQTGQGHAGEGQAGQEPAVTLADENPDGTLADESDRTDTTEGEDSEDSEGQLSQGALPRHRGSSPEDLADVAVNEAEPMPADAHPGEVDR